MSAVHRRTDLVAAARAFARAAATTRRSREHLAACPACRSCLDEIERDVVALPPLVVPSAQARRGGGCGSSLPRARRGGRCSLLVLRPRPHASERRRRDEGRRRPSSLGVVRERDGAIRVRRPDVRAGDRWKVIVTCPPERVASFDVAITEVGASARRSSARAGAARVRQPRRRPRRVHAHRRRRTACACTSRDARRAPAVDGLRDDPPRVDYGTRGSTSRAGFGPTATHVNGPASPRDRAQVAVARDRRARARCRGVLHE